MNKRWTIISIVILVIAVFALIKIFDEPKEFRVEDVMYDRSQDLMN